MRRFDKTKNILRANLLAEQRYMESKGLIKEVYDNYDNTADRAGESGINQYDDEKYDEMQKLKNMSPDMDDDVVAEIKATDHFNIMSNVAPYASIADYKVNPNASYEVTEDGLYGVEADVPTTAIRIFDNGREEQVKLPDAHRNAIKKEVEKDIRLGYEMGRNSTYFTVNDSEPEDKGGPESDRAESEYWSNNGLDENDGTKKSLTPEEIATYIVIGSEDIISRILNNIKDNPKSKEYIDALEKGKPYFSQYVKNGKLKDLYDLVGIHMPQHLYQGRMVNGTTWKYKDGVSPITV